MKKLENWLIKKRNILKKDLDNKFDLDEILIDILTRREVKTVEEANKFLNITREDEYSPYLLKNMDASANFVIDKIKNNKKILISLDYDVDGIISGAVSYKSLKRIGANVEYIFPDRVRDGYGINERIVNYAVDNSFDLIITFDNGIAAFDAVELARKNNIDIVVTDHHEVPKKSENGIIEDELVNANFIINPQQSDCTYPFKKICGAMVAYKLIETIYEKLGISKESIDEYELVAIATVCDVMDLLDENRVFVKYGLEYLINPKNFGLSVLLDKLNIHKPSVYDIGFKIGPCFNSSGRLSSANMALELLIEEDISRCNKLADELIVLNENRKELTKLATDEAISIIEEKKLYVNNIIILHLKDVHESLAGIIAGRIKEKYNVPAIIFTDSNDFIKGSARSTDSINIFNILSSFKKYFKKFGGHSAAAGLSIEKGIFDLFYKEIIEYMNGLIISRARNYLVDSIIPFDMIDIDFARKIDIFAPFGKANPEITFSSLGVYIKSLKINENNPNILKITFHNNMQMRYFTSFNTDEILNKIKSKLNLSKEYDIINELPKVLYQEKFDIIYKLSINEFKGNEYLNIELLTLR